MSIFQLNSFTNAFMNMQSDIYTQQNLQSDSGAVTRKWSYNQTIVCKVMPVKDAGGKGISDDKQYRVGSQGYIEDLHLKMQSPVRLSKRWRVGNIRTSEGEKVFIEIDKYGNEDTYFDILSSHPVLDPFGKIAYYEINLRRSQVQNNDTTAV